jgi:glycosyltransferase involved in cell wall biosynthesis
LIKATQLNARLYHFHDPELIPAGLLLRLLGKKVIYDIHENVLADLNEKGWLPFKKLARTAYRFFEKMAVRNFGIILANQSYEAHYREMGARYEVVSNYVDTETMGLKKSLYSPESDVLLLVGTLSAGRGLRQGLEALHILKKQGMIFRLKCVGPVNAEVEQMLSRLPFYKEIKEQVEWQGYKPISKAYSDAGECLAGIALLEDVPNHRHAYPTKIFEYMAAELPVICSDFPLYREVVGKHDCGICINPSEPKLLAEAVLSLYRNKEVAGRMSRNALSAVARYSWAGEEKKLLNFYKKMLS